MVEALQNKNENQPNPCMYNMYHLFAKIASLKALNNHTNKTLIVYINIVLFNYS